MWDPTNIPGVIEVCDRYEKHDIPYMARYKFINGLPLKNYLDIIVKENKSYEGDTSDIINKIVPDLFREDREAPRSFDNMFGNYDVYSAYRHLTKQDIDNIYQLFSKLNDQNKDKLFNFQINRIREGIEDRDGFIQYCHRNQIKPHKVESH